MVEFKISDRTTDDEMIKSDAELSESNDSPQYTSASSEDEENNHNKIAPLKGGRSVA